jgi:hypothetical protein
VLPGSEPPVAQAEVLRRLRVHLINGLIRTKTTADLCADRSSVYPFHPSRSMPDGGELIT